MFQWLVIGISGVTCGGKTTLAQKLREYFLSQRNVQLWNTSYTINDVQLLSQDDYFLPVDDLRHKWVEPLNAINFELITSLDMKQMISDIKWTMNGRYLTGDPIDNNDFSIDMPSYNGISEHITGPQNQHYGNRFISGHYPTHSSNTKILPTKSQHNKHNIQHRNRHDITPSNQDIEHVAHIMRINSQIIKNISERKINVLIIEGFMIFNQPELIALCNIKFHFHLPYEKCFERRRKRTYDPPDVTGYFEMCVWPYYEKNFMDIRARKGIIFLNGEVDKEKIFQFVLKRIIQYFEERLDIAVPPPYKIIGIPSCNNSDVKNSQIFQVCPMEQL